MRVGCPRRDIALSGVQAFDFGTRLLKFSLGHVAIDACCA